MRSALVISAAAALALTVAACGQRTESTAEAPAEAIVDATQNVATDLHREAAMTPEVPEANALVHAKNQIVEEGEEAAEAVAD